MQADDFPRTAFVELIDEDAAPICRRVTAWDGHGLVLTLDEAEATACRSLRLIDAEGYTLGVIPAQRKRPDAPAAA